VACVDQRGLSVSYAYLLGIYLGDGCLTPFHRGVWKLRIFMDARYTGIVESCKIAINEVAARTAGQSRREGCVEIYSYWKHWLCLFPQHGAGEKHLRPIRLEHWQTRLIEEHPKAFIRGLIHSDGCRAINRVKQRRYEYPRYFFTNHSADIRALFKWACGLIGVESRPNNQYNISVARRRSVEILDGFIGPKA
jgi:hypothetical protein